MGYVERFDDLIKRYLVEVGHSSDVSISLCLPIPLGYCFLCDILLCRVSNDLVG